METDSKPSAPAGTAEEFWPTWANSPEGIAKWDAETVHDTCNTITFEFAEAYAAERERQEREARERAEAEAEYVKVERDTAKEELKSEMRLRERAEGALREARQLIQGIIDDHVMDNGCDDGPCLWCEKAKSWLAAQESK